ncbi:neutral zinc metallopeptidase [Planococcus salinus]|nr:neutral zinc metallopeptidase [Planococcus salinus]
MGRTIAKLFFIAVTAILLSSCFNSQENSNSDPDDLQVASQRTGDLQPDSQNSGDPQTDAQDSGNQQPDSRNVDTQQTEEPQPFELPEGETAEADEELNSDVTTSNVDYTMYDFLEYVILDVHNFWAPIMVDAGYPRPWVSYVFPAPGESVYSSCSGEQGTNDEDFFYCPTDDQIVFSQAIAIKLWEGTYKVNDESNVQFNAGDFSVAALVAHEYAHSLQDELGWFPDNGEQLATSRSIELNADCLSGVWANSAYSRGLLDYGDIEEVMRTLSDIGNDSNAPAITHGFPAERTAAFMIGYNNGDAPSCDHYLFTEY